MNYGRFAGENITLIPSMIFITLMMSAHLLCKCRLSIRPDFDLVCDSVFAYYEFVKLTTFVVSQAMNQSGNVRANQ